MMQRAAPVLLRDDPDRHPLIGNVKVTQEDWLNLARDVLVHKGVGEIKILPLAETLNVSRSSFYWYFKNRADLLEALLDEWETRNTASLIGQCARHARSIADGVRHFFDCFLDGTQFDAGLDFAVREWARRDEAVRQRIDRADQLRLQAVSDMFLRYGFTPSEADIRARILYFMQIGYHALALKETTQERLDRVAGFLQGFTGEEPDMIIVEQLKKSILSSERRT